MDYNLENFIKNQKIFSHERLKEHELKSEDIIHNISFMINFINIANLNDVNSVMDDIIYYINDHITGTVRYILPIISHNDVSNNSLATISYVMSPSLNISKIRIYMFCELEQDVDILYNKLLSFKMLN